MLNHLASLTGREQHSDLLDCGGGCALLPFEGDWVGGGAGLVYVSGAVGGAEDHRHQYSCEEALRRGNRASVGLDFEQEGDADCGPNDRCHSLRCLIK